MLGIREGPVLLPTATHACTRCCKHGISGGLISFRIHDVVNEVLI